jgi:hypothetical protein
MSLHPIWRLAAPSGIVPVAIGSLNAAALAMDLQLGVLIAADFASDLLSFSLGVGSMAGPLSTIALHLPATIPVRHDAVGISRHLQLLSG